MREHGTGEQGWVDPQVGMDRTKKKKIRDDDNNDDDVFIQSNDSIKNARLLVRFISKPIS
jgi:hypothetical protein